MHSHDDEAKYMTALWKARPRWSAPFSHFDKAVFSKTSGNLDLTTRDSSQWGSLLPLSAHAALRITQNAQCAGITHGWKAIKSIADTE